MERKHESLEHIFEDNGGEEAVIRADDTGMIAQQRILVESEIADEGGEDELT